MTLLQNTLYVGVDVGKDELVAARDSDAAARVFANTPDGRAELIAHLRGLRRPLHVAFEATGGYEWPLWEALDAAGIAARQVAPAQVRSLAGVFGRRAKTDPIDARAIAAFAALRPEAGRALQARNVRGLRALVAMRRSRVADAKRIQTRMKRQADADMLALEEAMLALVRAQIAELNARIERAIAACPELARKGRLLRSIPGVGPVLTATLLAETPELGALTEKTVAALTGLAPIARDSGKKQGRRFITGGRKTVRDVAFMAATVAATHNPDLKAFFNRLRERGLPHKKAAIATARKLIVIANAVLKRGAPWTARPVT